MKRTLVASPDGPEPESVQFNPDYLAVCVAQMLRREYGLTVRAGVETSPTATMAAADLLRALHLVPATAPRRNTGCY